MEQQQIEELKTELAALEGQAQTQTQQTAETTDGSVLQPPKTLKELFDPENKFMLRSKALLATAVDENLPMAERLKAALEWRGMRTPRSQMHWHQGGDEELPNRLRKYWDKVEAAIKLKSAGVRP